MGIESTVNQLRAIVEKSGVDTAFVEQTAGCGEYEPALFDLCQVAVMTDITIPAELADTVLEWLSEYELMSRQDQEKLIEGITKRRESASPS